MKNVDKFVKDFLKLKPARIDGDMRKGFLFLYKGYSIGVNSDFNNGETSYYMFIVGKSDGVFIICRETFELTKEYYWSVDIDDFQKVVMKDLRKLKLEELDI